MRITVLLLLFILLTNALAYFSMNNTNDKEIGALVNQTWYDLLPQQTIQERNNLLKLLAPSYNASFHAVHALQISRVHLLRSRLGHY